MEKHKDDITAVIETPKGSAHKYDFEPETGRFKLEKMMPAGVVFPYDFGFIPDTEGADGDPLDIIVISEAGTFPGCTMDCRVIGAILAEQTERDAASMRNDRFLAVPVVSQMFADLHEINGLQHGILEQLEQFFKNYNEQAGKEFKPLRTIGATESLGIIAENLKGKKR